VGGANVDDIVHWFDEGGALKISPDERSETLLKGFSVVPGLLDLVDRVGLAGKKDPAHMVSASELVLEGLVALRRISRSEELGYVRARPEPKSPGYGKPGPGAGPNLFS
jgi:magnesium chelatase subunit I